MTELIGAELDAAVARAQGWEYDKRIGQWWRPFDGSMVTDRLVSFSTDWSQGGPMIERERIAVIANFSHPADGEVVFLGWLAEMPSGLEGSGPTPLVAAMRAFVASKA